MLVTEPVAASSKRGNGKGSVRDGPLLGLNAFASRLANPWKPPLWVSSSGRGMFGEGDEGGTLEPEEVAGVGEYSLCYACALERGGVVVCPRGSEWVAGADHDECRAAIALQGEFEFVASWVGDDRVVHDRADEVVASGGA